MNPEKAWPHLQALADATTASGKALVPRFVSMSFPGNLWPNQPWIDTAHRACRLTLYPEYALNAGEWLDSSHGRSSMSAAVLRQSDSCGLLRASSWAAGAANAEADREFQSESIVAQSPGREIRSVAGEGA